jgi:hypothetical protein
MKQTKIFVLLMIAITLSACSYPAHQSGGAVTGANDYAMGSVHSNYTQRPYVKQAYVPSAGMQKYVKGVMVSPYTPQAYIKPVFVPVQ